MHKLLATLVLLLGLSTLTGAQDISGEHRYQFQVQGLDTPYQQKVFTELMTGFDPHLKVSYSQQLHQVRLLAYRPLDLQEIIAMAAQVGVTLTPRRMPGERVDMATE